MIIRVLPTLFVIALITASCAQEEQERPWVFRSVLDGQPRMITAELDTNLFVAYDAGSGLFYKAWDGSVTLEGAVYTSVHGPQPTSTGTDYFVATPASVWTVYQHGEPQHVQAFYRGHKFEDGYVSFMTLLVVATGDFMRVEESPRARRDEKGNLGLERVYSMSSTNENLVAGITANAGSLLGRESYSVTGGVAQPVGNDDQEIQVKITLARDTETQFVVWFEAPQSDSLRAVDPDIVLATNNLSGKTLIQQSDCSVCHNAQVKTVGPGWGQIAQRYAATDQVVASLSSKIIDGGGGNWGNVQMTPHPELSESNAQLMVEYILSMDDDGEVPKSTEIAEVEAQDASDTNVSVDLPTATIAMTFVGPIIDGEVDDVWSGIEQVSIRRRAVAGSTEQVDDGPTVRLLYDSQFLYALFEVKDDFVINDSADPYNDDAVEIYLDGGYEREEFFDENDVQYIFPIDGSGVWINGDRWQHVGIEYVPVETEDGYIVEIKIPLANVHLTPISGFQFGLQLQVDDDDVGGDAVQSLAWSANEPVSWFDTSIYGTAILGDGVDAPMLASIPREPGVSVTIYDIRKMMPRLYRLAPRQLPNEQFEASQIDFFSSEDFAGYTDYFLMEVDGFLSVDSEGEHLFQLVSDEGSKLWLDNKLVIDNDGLHTIEAKEASVDLSPGLHSIRMRYFEGRGDQQLTLNWQTPKSRELETIPARNLSHRAVSNSSMGTGNVEAATSPGPKYVIEPPLVDRPGDTVALTGVHPAFELATVRPDHFEPRVGGMDFLSDGRLVICTWDAEGAVYILDNVLEGAGESAGKNVQVKRIGGGLAEPLGLKVVDDKIYVLQKQELTQLIDHDGDDVIDEYRTIANGWGVTANFHEFAFGLVFKNEHFYATLATAIEPGGASASPQNHDRGRVIKIGLDGSHEFVAEGLRTPNGIGIGVDNEIFVTDNQGDWLPSSKLVHVQDGAFYGSRSVDPIGTSSKEVTPPVVWMPQDEIGNSPSQPLALVHGPYAGQMAYGEVTHGGLKRVFVEQVDGQYQGALFRFTQGLEAGINRTVRGPQGQIFVGGIGSAGNWGQTGKKKFGLQRLTYTGAVPFEMLAVRAFADGLEIEFTKPLPGSSGSNPVDYKVSQWRYVATADYGGPKVDHVVLDVLSSAVSEDRHRVFLEIEGMKEEHVVYLHLPGPFATETGEQLWSTEAWYTLNRIPSKAKRDVESVARSTTNDLDLFSNLLQGSLTEHWTGYPNLDISKKWSLRNGILHFIQSEDGPEESIISNHSFGNFELRLDWKLDVGGNSGVFYHVDSSSGDPHQSGPEMQILDNKTNSDGRNPLTSAGANYGLYAPTFDATRPAGEWNNAKLIVDHRQVQHWLNGHLVVEYTLHDSDWERRLRSSKFADMPAYGRNDVGHIVLQEHDEPVWFRNVFIRELD